MKGYIDEQGRLHIDRVGEDTVVQCKYQPRTCSDKCAGFGDPFLAQNKKGILVPICDNEKLKFESFKDKRFSSEAEEQLAISFGPASKGKK